MIKIGVIGLGGIAEKAYLPVLSKKKAEIHLCTRNEARLLHIAEQYRFKYVHQNLESLISSGITGAFVHTATPSHYEIVETLLNNNIHVYVDKPVTYDFTTTEKLVALAQRKGLLLMVGFNRRFAPSYQNLKNVQDINMIIMQKNRKSLPGEVRVFVLDDFIHVVDSLLYLFPYPIAKILVNGKKKDNLLYHAIVQFISGNGATAIGIMNRDSGTVEEKIEIFSSEEKRVVYNLNESLVLQDKHEKKWGTSDWEPTLFKRGFEQIVDDFLQKISSSENPATNAKEILRTHKICEEIVNKLIL
jgi:virulence factor